MTFIKNSILEESRRARCSRFILLSRVEAHGAVIPEGERDEVGPAADRAVLGEGLAAFPLGSTKTSLSSPQNAQRYVMILILHAIMSCKEALLERGPIVNNPIFDTCRKHGG